ncbi:MAG: GNAT family N-acetyltransferase [Candidatus Methanofastidiosia archaeon]
MDKIGEIVIRKYVNDDFEQLIEIAKALPEWFTTNGIKHMSIDLLYQHGFVAVLDFQIVGFLSFFVSEGIGQIGWIGILPEFHREGIGRKLIDGLISELRQKGVRELRVNTLGDSVEYEPYERTRAFYRGIGFKDFQRIKQDDPECPELLILAKNIQ